MNEPSTSSARCATQKNSNNEQVVLDTKTTTDPPKPITHIARTSRIKMASITQSVPSAFGGAEASQPNIDGNEEG